MASFALGLASACQTRTPLVGEGAVSAASISIAALSVALVAVLALYAHARLKAKRRQDRLDFIVETLPHIIWVADSDGQLTDCNETGLRWFGVGRSKLRQNRWYEVIHPDDLAQCTQRWEAATRDNTTFLNEQRLRRHDGAFEWHRVEAIPILLAGRVVGWYGVSTNIDRQKKIESAHEDLALELKDAKRFEAVGVLAASVAHSVNNVLTTIQAAVDLLRLQDQVDVEPTRLTETIADATRRGAQITGQLLSFSGKHSERPERLAPNDVLQSLHRVLGRMLGETVTLEIDLSDDVPDVWIDRGHFEQVVLNLAVNAIDAMPNGGRLGIRTDLETDPGSMTPGGLILRVHDNGCGIDPTLGERIFEPFVTSKRRGKGTGLGLAAVRSIVEDAQGSVAVDSASDSGTVFTIRLPAAPAQTQALTRATGDGDRSDDLLDATVLLCEDDPAILSLVAARLESAGHYVLSSSSVQQARHILSVRTEPVDALITDVQLGDGDGPALAREVRRRWRATPVIYVTGYAPDLAHSFDAEPADPVLVKPFSAAQLLGTLQRLLQQQRSPSP